MRHTAFTTATDGHGFSILSAPDFNPEQIGDHVVISAGTEKIIREYLTDLGLNSDEPIEEIAYQLFESSDDPISWLYECAIGANHCYSIC